MLIATYAEQAISTITRWDRNAQLQRLTDHLIEHRGVELVELVLADEGSEATEAQLARTVAADTLAIVETLPSLLTRLRAVAEDRRVAPAIRVSLLSVIAYVAQPHDAIPDDGSVVGLIDDAAVIYALAPDFFEVLAPPRLTREHLASYTKILRFAVPDDRIGIVDQYVQQVRAAWQAISMLPPPMLESLVIRLYDDPTTVSALLAQPVGAPAPGAGGLAAGATGPAMGMPGAFGTAPTGPFVRSTPLGGSIMTEGDSISMSFAGGGGASMVGNDIVAWD